MKKPPPAQSAPHKPKRTAVSRLKGAALTALEELRARMEAPSEVPKATGQLRLLDVGIGDFVVRIPEVVLEMLEGAESISVADATARAGAAGKSWQDTKATLELRLRLVKARALWERGTPKSAALAAAEFNQVSASPSSRRNELILEAAARSDSEGRLRREWSPGFSLALLRSASGAFANSFPAALALIDALTGAGEATAAGLLLQQLIAAWALFPSLERTSLAERIARLEVDARPPLEAALAAAPTPGPASSG